MASKDVELIIEIDEEGVIHMQPSGTEGSECIDLMKFVDKVASLITVETQRTDGGKTKKVQTTGRQGVGRK